MDLYWGGVRYGVEEVEAFNYECYFDGNFHIYYGDGKSKNEQNGN